MARIHAVIFDVDGTLVNSNDAQAKSWVEALKEFGYSVPYEKVRPLIGMGGDKVLPETIGVQKDSEKGKQISKRRNLQREVSANHTGLSWCPRTAGSDA